MCHQLNYDLWLKVAECYGSLSGLDVLSTPLEFHHSTEEFTWYAAASLARVDILLRSIAGNAGYLKEKKCLKLQSELLPVITRLPESFLLKAREVIIKTLPCYNYFFNLNFCSFSAVMSTTLRSSIREMRLNSSIWGARRMRIKQAKKKKLKH